MKSPSWFVILLRIKPRASPARRLIFAAARRWSSRLLKKTHMLRCAQSPRYNVLNNYASARRFFARLASEIFLSSLQTEFNKCEGGCEGSEGPNQPGKSVCRHPAGGDGSQPRGRRAGLAHPTATDR